MGELGDACIHAVDLGLAPVQDALRTTVAIANYRRYLEVSANVFARAAELL